MGPMTYGQKKEEIFIGRDLGMHRDFSEDMAKKIDAEVRRIVDTAYKTAKDIVTQHKDKLLSVSDVLLEKESLDGKQLDKILGITGESHHSSKSGPKKHTPARSRTRPPRNRPTRSQQTDSKKDSPKPVNETTPPVPQDSPKAENKGVEAAPQGHSQPKKGNTKEAQLELPTPEIGNIKETPKDTLAPDQGNVKEPGTDKPASEEGNTQEPTSNE